MGMCMDYRSPDADVMFLSRGFIYGFSFTSPPLTLDDVLDYSRREERYRGRWDDQTRRQGSDKLQKI